MLLLLLLRGEVGAEGAEAVEEAKKKKRKFVAVEGRYGTTVEGDSSACTAYDVKGL